MVVAFVVGELNPDVGSSRSTMWNRFPRRLVPVSRRFVPEPVWLTYIVADLRFASLQTGPVNLPANLAATPSAISEFIRSTPMINAYRTDPYFDERICSICAYRAGEIERWVQQVTLQTRLRRPVWPNTAAFRAFVNAHKEHVEINACRSCRMRCGMPYAVWGNPARPS